MVSETHPICTAIYKEPEILKKPQDVLHKTSQECRHINKYNI